MTHSVRLLARLGSAIQKVGEHVSKIGGGRSVHTKPSGHLGAWSSVPIDDDRSKAEAQDTVHLQTFSNAVDKDGGMIVRNDVESSFTNGDRSNSFNRQSILQNLCGVPNLNQGGQYASQLSSAPVRKSDVIRAAKARAEAARSYQAIGLVNRPVGDPEREVELAATSVIASDKYSEARAEYDRLFLIWKGAGFPE